MAFPITEPVVEAIVEPQPIKTGFEHKTEMFKGRQTDREHNTVDVTSRLVVAVLAIAGKLGGKDLNQITIADSPFDQRYVYEITAKEGYNPDSSFSRVVDMRISGPRLKGVSDVQAEYVQTHTNKSRVLDYFASYEEGDNGPLTILKRHYESPTPVAIFFNDTWYGAFWNPFGGTILLKPITSSEDWEQHKIDFANFRSAPTKIGMIEKAEDIV